MLLFLFYLFIFFCLLSGVVDDKMSVLLYDTTGSQDVCINEFLVHNGYCQTAGLGYDACHRAVSIECRKTTTKVISNTLANHNGRRQSHEPIKIQNTM